MRLLLQRHADQGLGTSLEESEPTPADPQPYERASLPLRHLSAGDEGDQRVHQNGEQRDDRHPQRYEFLAPRFAQRRRCPHRRLQHDWRAARFSRSGARRGCRPPDPNAIDSWVAVHADNTATVYFGKCELGQGNTTGMLQIAGEELDLDMSQLRAAQLDTNVTPNQGATSSSSSIHRGGPQLRAAAASAPSAAHDRGGPAGVQMGSLTVSEGIVSIVARAAAARSNTATCSATSRLVSSSPAPHRKSRRAAISSSARGYRASTSSTR